MGKWRFYTPAELKPEGWLKRQLEIQAGGLSGNLDKIWRDIRDSAWIGGSAEGWERVPYWLDGFVPLAYLLGDEDMISRAKRYIDAILELQREDGWICPCTDEEIPKYDTWAVLLISKALTVYYACSGDERIPEAIYRMLRNYYELLSSGKIGLFDWGKARWFEGFIAINFTAQRYDEPWIKELAKILKTQGTDYAEKTGLWKRPLNKWTFDTHIVNIGMMLKSEAVSCDILGEKYSDQAERLHGILEKYNGTPVGLFTGDECLSGLSPIQGTELCAVAEQMYSYELLYAYTGDSKWAERLEMLAFNALPATISDDMWTHQYVQMSNQIACERFPGRSQFRTNGSEAHLFGLEPNYGCCTANFNQAWPKFALSAFMYSENTVICAVQIPSALDDANCSIVLETDYPFRNESLYRVTAKKSFELRVRIPRFARSLTVSGKAYTETGSGELSFEFSAGEKAELRIAFETKAEFVRRPHDLASVKCGSLVFALPIEFEKRMHEYERDGVERKFPYCDYELVGKSDWNYGYCGSELIVERTSPGEIPFSSVRPPVTVRTEVRKVPWELEDGFETVCAKLPAARVGYGEAKTAELWPYACAKLRMTELPTVE